MFHPLHPSSILVWWRFGIVSTRIKKWLHLSDRVYFMSCDVISIMDLRFSLDLSDIHHCHRFKRFWNTVICKLYVTYFMSQTAQSRLELKKVNDRRNFDKMTKFPIEEVFILVKMISSPETNDFRIGGSSRELLLLV